MMQCDPGPSSVDDHPSILAVTKAALADLNRRRVANKLAPLTENEFFALDGTVFWQASDPTVRYRHANIEYLWTKRGYFSWYRIDAQLAFPVCLLTGETPIQKFRV